MDAARLREKFDITVVLNKQAQGDRVVVWDVAAGIPLRAAAMPWLAGTRNELNDFPHQSGQHS